MQIRSVQLTQNFFFGTESKSRLYNDISSCDIQQEGDALIVNMTIKNDNKVHTYRIPLSLCVIEYL